MHDKDPQCDIHRAIDSSYLILVYDDTMYDFLANSRNLYVIFTLFIFCTNSALLYVTYYKIYVIHIYVIKPLSLLT